MDEQAMQLLLDRLARRVTLLRSDEVGDALNPASPLVALSPGVTLASLERYLPAPSRHRAIYAARTAQAFTELVLLFRSGSDSVLFADVASRVFTAVLDFGSMGRPSWRQHRVVLKLEPSRQLTAWLGINGKGKNQDFFADFIEERALDFVSPDAATMLELALNFQAKKDVQFASSKRPGDGSVHFQYTEEVRGGPTAGELTVPERVMIRVPLFMGGEPTEVEARFRYRVSSGGLVMWFDFYRLEDQLEEEVKKIAAHIEEATQLPMIEGAAPPETPA